MKSEKEKMLNGELYNPQNPQLVEEIRTARELTFRINQLLDSEKRADLLKQLFGSTGEYKDIEPSFRCDYGYNIHVGENFFANFNCVILDVCEVRIGDTFYWDRAYIFRLQPTR